MFNLKGKIALGILLIFVLVVIVIGMRGITSEKEIPVTEPAKAITTELNSEDIELITEAMMELSDKLSDFTQAIYEIKEDGIPIRMR